jgi:tRNA A-37 threonylcarbamoyl transferase component Bud32
MWADPSLPESLLRRAAASPGDLIRRAAGRPIKISHESIIVEAEWPATERSIRVALKQYLPKNLGKALTGFFRPAKAMHNWRKAEFLLARGIPTPRPLLACRPRGWKGSATSFLATEWINGAENLHLFAWRIAVRPLNARLRLAARCAGVLGHLLGRMHAAGAAHRDLKAANLLVVEEGSELAAYLVDLDGLQPGQPIGFQRQARELARLAAGMTAHPWIARSVLRRFLGAYLQESATTTNWKPLWRAIADETAKYVSRKRQRGQPVL